MSTTLRTTARTSVVVLSVLTIVALALIWRHDGGRWFIVETPSMGTEAPRGSLLLTKPTTVANTNVGDFVTFTSPTSDTVFSHRVTEVTETGLHTQGDVNAVPDAWTITDQELIGEVVFHAQGAGWALRALPILIIAFIVIWVATTRLARTRRTQARLLGLSAAVAVVGYIHKPWVGLAKLGQSAPGGESSDLFMEVISTGILPINVSREGGDPSRALHNGDTATIRFPDAADNTDYFISSHLDLNIWWWLGVALVCFAPLLWVLIVGLPPVPLEATDADTDADADADADADTHAADNDRVSLPDPTAVTT